MLLVLLGIAGMAWADVSLAERWGGLGSFLKLLFIPLLLVHFRRSKLGLHVFAAYALSCIAFCCSPLTPSLCLDYKLRGSGRAGEERCNAERRIRDLHCGPCLSRTPKGHRN